MENRNSKFCLSLLLYLSLIAQQQNEVTLDTLRMLLQSDDEERKKQIASTPLPTKPMQIVPVGRNYSGSIRVHVLVNELYPNIHGEALGAASLLFYDTQATNCMDTFDDVFRTKSLARGISVSDDDLDLILAANGIEFPQLFERDQSNSFSGCNTVSSSSRYETTIVGSSTVDASMPDNATETFQHFTTPPETSPCDVPFSSLSLEDLPASVDSGVHDEVDTLDGHTNDSEIEDKVSEEHEFPSLPELNDQTNNEFDPNESFLTGEEVDELLATIDYKEISQDGIFNEFSFDNDLDQSMQENPEMGFDYNDRNDSHFERYEADNILPEVPHSQNGLNTFTGHDSTAREGYVRRPFSSRYISTNSDSIASSSVDLYDNDDVSYSSTQSVSSSDTSAQHEGEFPSSSASYDSQSYPIQSTGPSSSPTSAESNLQHQHKDVQLLLDCDVPFTYEEVAYSSNDEFKRMRSTPGLTDAQCTAMLDARRRATNRKAAERCRQQKNIERNGLSDDLKRLVERKREMERQVAKARHRRDRARDNLAAQRQELFSRLRDSSNRPLHPNQWKLQLNEEGQLMLVRREITSES